MRDSMKKIASVCLFAALALSAAACGSESVQKSEIENGADTQNASAETEADREEVKDNLPAFDFEGTDFTLYLRDWGDGMIEDFVSEESSGDIVKDAVYRRNLSVSERFNIKFQYHFDDSNNTTYQTTAVTAIMAGDDVNDVLALHGAFCFRYARQGYLLEWTENMPYCDLSRTYWDQDFVNTMSVAGKLFGMTGAISHRSVGGTFCLLFNKDLMRDSDLEFPYDSVRNGTWTYEKFAAMCADVSGDLNGDGVIKPEDDRYSVFSGSWGFPICAFYMGGDRVVSLDRDGAPQLTVMTDRTTALLEKLMDFCQKPGVYISDYSPAYDGDIFGSGRALFFAGTLGSLALTRNLDVDFGVIPYPKYEESGDRYYSLVDAGENVFAVPVIAQNPERTSVILEALAAEGMNSVIPAFYETALKTKYARDDESADMLEIIRGSRYFDYGYYDATISWDLSYIGRNVLLNGGNFASFYQSREKEALKNLEEVYQNYLDAESLY